MNEHLLHRLYDGKYVKSNEPTFIYRPVKQITVDVDKIEGMLLGAAIGDALGGTSEWLSSSDRFDRFGFIDKYVTDTGIPGVGVPTDDTQLTFDTVDVILDKRYLDGQALVKRFVSHDIYGIGSTVSQFVRNYTELVYPWYASGVIGGAGNGALMRISPALIPSLKSKSENPIVDTVIDTMVTHNSPMTIGTTVAFTMLLRSLMNDKTPFNGEMTECFADITSKFTGNDIYTTKSTGLAGFRGSVPDFLRKSVQTGLSSNMSVTEFGERFGPGYDGLDTTAMVLFILEKYLDTPEDALLEAVNHTLDNDTIGAIVGSAVGARYGKRAFRKEWVTDLSGRTRLDDDGAVFTKIAAVKAFLK